MTLPDMFERARLTLEIARSEYERGGLAMAHHDLARLHVALHELDAVLIAELLKHGRAQ